MFAVPPPVGITCQLSNTQPLSSQPSPGYYAQSVMLTLNICLVLWLRMCKTLHSFHLYDHGCSEVCTINQQPDMLVWGAKRK